jgi:hypothetical protein
MLLVTELEKVSYNELNYNLTCGNLQIISSLMQI